MPKKAAYARTTVVNPFGASLGLKQYVGEPGQGRCVVETGPQHHSPGAAVHGGLLFTVMDNCMGATLRSTLAPDEGCATIEMKINYLTAVFGGTIESATRLVRKGKRVAVLQSQLSQGKEVVAIATSTYAIFKHPGRVGAVKPAASKSARTKKEKQA